jgi:hypothetical protein
VALALVFSFFCRKKSDVYFYCGLVLFLSMSIYSMYHVCTKGFYQAYFDSNVDISYFIFCVPFALYHYTAKYIISGEAR